MSPNQATRDYRARMTRRIAQALGYHMLARGFGDRDLAAALSDIEGTKVARSTVQSYRLGNRSMPAHRLLAIEEALGMSPGTLAQSCRQGVTHEVVE